MKQTDFDRLKAVCEKEGFELLNESANDNDKFFIVKKAKDIWEGVEFITYTEKNTRFFLKGKNYKVNYLKNNTDLIVTDEENTNHTLTFDYLKTDFKPSTESAYIEQLKSECFKRFGEIKEGDRFENASKTAIRTAKLRYNLEWDYSKEKDQFFFYNIELYINGVWATRVKEKVKVNCSDIIANQINTRTDFMFSITTRCIDENDFKSFLASKLEEYLNKE